MNKRGFAGTLVVLIIIVAIFFILLKFKPNLSQEIFTGKSIEFSVQKGCIDTDKPSQYFDRKYYNVNKKGTVYAYSETCLKSLKDCESQSESDICVNNNNLKEFYCYNNDVLNSVIWCSNGCENGRCLE
ncbi:hypothetical protein J4436_03710 [Candidatus Woesearchaeota archaeon]|nr:hypothetical protein [Candidatus Woesearchaeota archaeon]